MFTTTVFVFFLVIFGVSSSRRRLNEYIEHYEALEYDADTLHKQHLRVRRSTGASSELRLDFTAHEKPFRLRLRRDLSAFSQDFIVEGARGQLHDVDTSHIYHGELIGDPQSSVFGSVTDGVFEGKIIASDDSFYVEHARRYFPPNGTRTRVHSVIYREGDVSDPYAHRRHGHIGSCGMEDESMQWMKRFQESGVEDASSPPQASSPTDDSVRYYNKYSQEANTGEHSRSRRAAANLLPAQRNTCSLYIQTDPLMWLHVRKGFPDHRDWSKKMEVDMRTREEILLMISQHVTALNYIYSNSKFDGRLEHRNIKFEVQKIKIDDEWSCMRHEPSPFCRENIKVSNFLDLHTLTNYEDFCLAYVFTYRNFEHGILSLGWQASASGAAGGICEKYKNYTENIGGKYISTKRSLNTGIMTFVNNNSRVPPKVSQLTLAHVIGHNFGSPHDYPAECRPGGQQGNFIMFASATSGERPNNSRFSACSIGNISQVLDAVRDGRKRNCFTASEGAFCGNKIVEVGEECDCGYDEIECHDRCCYPRIVSALDREINVTARGCTRRARTQCSASQGPCCRAETCQFVSAYRNQTCREATECSHASFCPGHSADCPGLRAMPNHTKCNNGTQICLGGECSGSICLAWNMTECFLSSAPRARGDGVAAAVVDRRKLCQLACQLGPGADTCRSSADFADQVGLPVGGISLRPGSPCDNFQGYCDESLNCREVNGEVLRYFPNEADRKTSVY